MTNYKLSEEAEKDLIRIHQFGVHRFGVAQADKYLHSFTEYFLLIAKQPYSFPSIDHYKKGYRKCVCGSDSIIYKININNVEIITIIGNQDVVL